MNKEQEVKYYKADCGCVLQEDGNSWRWVYDCKAGWGISSIILNEFPFSVGKTQITKAEVAILKLIGKK